MSLLLPMLILLHPNFGSATVSPDQWCGPDGTGWSRADALARGWTLAEGQVDPAAPVELAPRPLLAESVTALPPRIGLAGAILAASDDDLISLPAIGAKNLERLRSWARTTIDDWAAEPEPDPDTQSGAGTDSAPTGDAPATPPAADA